MGKVYWITGLSGAGKTTIGKIVYEELRKKHPNTVFLDGDTLREVFGGVFGYEEKERKQCAMCYARLCSMLEKQDINVVCCTISMFHSVREWNRQHIPNYCEIYVKVSWKTLQERNQKGLYSDMGNGEEKPVVGIQIEFEEPIQPDIVLINDGKKSPKEQAQEILAYVNETGCNIRA